MSLNKDLQAYAESLPVELNRTERARIAALKKRRDWLAARTMVSEDRDGRRLDWDMAELTALRWAIDYITKSIVRAKRGGGAAA